MTKKKDKQEEVTLTEWQKRNLEFLKKKQAEKLEQEKLEEERLAEKRAQLEERKEAEKADKDKSQTSQEGARETSVKDQDPPVEKKQSKTTKAKKKKRIPPKQFWQAMAVITIASLVLLISLFMISPYSKQKNLTVSGADNASEQELLEQTGIKASDYISSVFWHSKDYAQAVKAANSWVKDAQLTYQFPNKFTLKVDEYRVIAYRQTEQGYVPILENGKRIDTVNASELPESYLTINLDSEKDVQTLIKKLAGLEKDLTDQIETVSLANSKTSKDLLLLQMTDGISVRVPLSELELKLPYYPKIKPNLLAGQILDMEVGVYSTSPEIEAQIAELRTSSETSTETTASDQNDASTELTSTDPNQEVTEASTQEASND